MLIASQAMAAVYPFNSVNIVILGLLESSYLGKMRLIAAILCNKGGKPLTVKIDKITYKAALIAFLSSSSLIFPNFV